MDIKVKFLVPFKTPTDEFKKGDIVEMSEENAEKLFYNNMVEIVSDNIIFVKEVIANKYGFVANEVNKEVTEDETE